MSEHTTAEVKVAGPLWMMHVLGPDDIYAAPDHATAVQWCADLNRLFDGGDALLVGVPAIWTGSPKAHAEQLPLSVSLWGSAAPASPPAEKGEGEPITMSDLMDVFERPFTDGDDPRLQCARVLTKAEAEAVLEFRGDLRAALSAQPVSPSEGEGWADADLEDLLSDAIGDSIDMDWTYRDGAKAIMAALKREGLSLSAPPADDAAFDINKAGVTLEGAAHLQTLQAIYSASDAALAEKAADQ